MAEVQKIKSLYRGRIFDLFLEKVALPNGVVLEREVVRHPGAAAMVPFLDEDTVILIRQYRHAVDRYLWEIPAGTLEKGENPMDCARRELVEEIGYEADELEKITELLPAPGYTDECIHIFSARRLRISKQSLDDDEVLEAQAVAFDKAIDMIGKGDIQDAKSIVGLLLSRLLRKK
jgi:ADP-ribose pyrophosphatase